MGQQVDSIAFHLYTDSLKKGTHNYINVDGRKPDGSWLPLTASELTFSATAGVFQGNSLVLDKDFTGEFVDITVSLIRNTTLTKTTRIYIKKIPDPDNLPKPEDILPQQQPSRKKKKKKH